MFVAESKWQQQPDEYARRVRAGDEKAIMELLTHAAVEVHRAHHRTRGHSHTRQLPSELCSGYRAVRSWQERVLRRVRRKASIFGQDIWADDDAPAEVRSQLKLDPEAIVSLYRDFVIPLTKEAEARASPSPDLPATCHHRPLGRRRCAISCSDSATRAYATRARRAAHATSSRVSMPRSPTPRHHSTRAPPLLKWAWRC